MRKQYERPITTATQKQCTKCKNFKNFSDFHRYTKSPDGYKHFCKTCVREYDQNEDDIRRVYPRKNYEGKIHCRNCNQYFIKEEMHQGNTYCKNCAPVVRNMKQLKKYGMTTEKYLQMLEEQNYSCKICGRQDKTFRKRLSVDHDHSCCAGAYSCGKCVRGLLCHHCNAALGNIQDSIDLLEKMIEYLRG